ncbi:lasso peptide biosynthesis PqqD family chaperone [Frankia canadensis]|nr:lasso peptide biosynthesis PqqD family chaperone [Frankia canadensis]
MRAPTEYGAVLLHTGNGQYWTLNPTADLVLRVMLAGGDTAAAVRELCSSAEVEPEAARRDVEGLLAQLTDVGLLEPAAPADYSPDREAGTAPGVARPARETGGTGPEQASGPRARVEAGP